MKNVATYISGMPTLEILDVSGNIISERKEKSFAVKNLLEGLLKSKNKIRTLNISGNRGINNDGTLNLLMQYVSESRSLK